MILEHAERHRDKQSTIQWYEFQFSTVQRKSTAVFTSRLERAAAQVASVKLQGSS